MKMQDKNKAWIAAGGAFITGLLMWLNTQYQLDLPPVLIGSAATVVTGLLTWYIPNKEV